MKPGDIIICRGSYDYHLTQGKEYAVIKYEPAKMSNLPGFTWPAYVIVEDDMGKKVHCYASRFIPKEST